MLGAEEDSPPTEQRTPPTPGAEAAGAQACLLPCRRQNAETAAARLSQFPFVSGGDLWFSFPFTAIMACQC